MRFSALFLLLLIASHTDAQPVQVFVQWGNPNSLVTDPVSAAASGASYDLSADLASGVFVAGSSMQGGLVCCYGYSGIFNGVRFTNVTANQIVLPAGAVRMHVAGTFGHVAGTGGTSHSTFVAVLGLAPPGATPASVFGRLWAFRTLRWDSDGALLDENARLDLDEAGATIDVIASAPGSLEFEVVLPEIVVDPGQMFRIVNQIQTINAAGNPSIATETGPFTARLSMVLPPGVAVGDLQSNATVPLNWVLAAGANDADGDGLADTADNCINVANPAQRDTDGDGIGNFCDADIVQPQDCFVNAADIGALRQAFFSTPASPNWNPDADFNGDGVVNGFDLGVMRSSFFSPPGPSGIPNLCP